MRWLRRCQRKSSKKKHFTTGRGTPSLPRHFHHRRRPLLFQVFRPLLQYFTESKTVEVAFAGQRWHVHVPQPYYSWRPVTIIYSGPICWQRRLKLALQQNTQLDGCWKEIQSPGTQTSLFLQFGPLSVNGNMYSTI